MSRSFLTGSIAGAAVGLVSLASVSLMSSPLGADRANPDQAAPDQAAPDLAANGGGDTSANAGQQAASVPAPAAATAPATAAAPAAVAAPATSAADAAPDTALLEVPKGSEFTRPKSDDSATVPGNEPAPADTAAPATVAPLAEQPPALADIAPAAVPESPAAAPKSLAEPATPPAAASANPPAVMPRTDPAPSATLPAVSSEPAPDAAIADAAPAPVTGAAEPAGNQPAGNQPAGNLDAAPTPTMPPATTAPATTVPAGATTPFVAPAPIIPPVLRAGAAPDQPAGTESAPKVVDLTPRAAQPTPDAGTETAPDAAPDATVVEPQPDVVASASPEAPSNLPQPGLKRLVPGVKINRLPAIGVVNVPSADPAADAAPTPADGAPMPALGRFAARFSNPDNKPVLSIMLIDIGVEAGGLDASALSALPFAVTIAVDPMRKDATSVEASYRAAGSEVAIFAGDLPAGATAADLEVAYQSYVQALPEAVALTGSTTAEFQRSSQTAQHLAELLAVDGRGLIGYVQGLNPAQRAAERAHIGNASVEKLFGPAEDNSGTLGRELDRAAFSAGQKGSAVIALPTTPEAITGLIAWASGPSAAAVAIAPVSAVMANGG